MSQLPTKTTTTRHDVKWSFATVLRACRDRLGISQEELAGRAGLHRTYVSDIERGARNLSLESIDKLAKALEIPVSTFFSRLSELPHPAGGTSSALATDEVVDILLVEVTGPGDTTARPLPPELLAWVGKAFRPSLRGDPKPPEKSDTPE